MLIKNTLEIVGPRIFYRRPNLWNERRDNEFDDMIACKTSKYAVVIF